VVRKTVTILFADVTGSTAMGEQSDPEALRRVMTRFFEVSRATLERHGATVEKFIGDAVMAVFGVPAVHEDDALRAARAALELRRNVAALGIELRIGINTGEVVAEDGETLVTGDAVNVAARLEQGASPGEILLGDATYRFARDALQAEAVAPLNAKGKSQPVMAWRLVDVLDDAPAFTRAIDARFVGRGDELARLIAAFERVVRTNAARRFTLLGAPGIGKSRLARELVQHVSGQARVVVGRCQAYGEGITYLPLAEMVRSTAGADRNAIAAVAGDDLVADRIAAAIGVGGVAGTKEETQWAARRYLEVLAADRPLLVVLDDLHWAEPTFLDLVEYVADFATAPMLLLCTGRAELLDARPGWTGPRPNAEVLALEPLSADEAAQLAGDVDDETRRRILDTAEGNPLFVEQLVALQAQAGADIGIPPTLQALLAARLDSLGPAERTVIERASVEGRLFHRGSVTELVPANVRPDTGAVLLALVRKEFVRPDRAQFPGDDGYRFTHVLLRDAAYEAMSKQLRADLHEKLFDWLQRVAPERVGEMEEILAYHLERSALYRTELDLPDENHAGQRAAQLLARSGNRAYDRGDVSAAQGLLSRAVSLLPPGDPTRVRALPLIAAAILDAATGMERALGLVAQAVEESRAADDRAAELSAWAIHQLVSLQSVPDTDTERIRRELETRGPEIERLGDARALVYLRRLQLAIAVTEMVDLDSAAERLLAAARDAGDRPSALQAMLFLTASSALGSIPVDEALLMTQRQFRALAQGPVEEAAVDDIEGLLRGMGGDFDEGRRLIRRARATFSEFGLSRLTAVGTARDEALVERYAGDIAAVERLLRSACDELRSIGETGVLSTIVGELAEALYDLGRYAEADEAGRESERLAPPTDAATHVLWRGIRSKLLARQGEGDEAIRLVGESIEWAGARPEELGNAYANLAEVRRLGGDSDRAAEALERAIALYEQKGMMPMAERMRRRLAELRSTA
jgi:class 3 adenylate cyclase/tetratricopeptide (TPR) repeat protein